MSPLRTVAALAAFGLLAAACGSDDDTGGGSIASCEVGQTDGNLAMYNWAEYIDPEQLATFEEEYGVSVTMDVFDSNEAMRPVIAAGNSGYDLIVPSSYMIDIMSASGDLLELDIEALPNVENIDDEFRGREYDPDDRWSVAYMAGTTGLAVDTAVVGSDVPKTWGLIFDPALSEQYSGQISMLNDSRETLGAALTYLGYSINTTNADEVDEARDLVIASRDRIAAFDSESADELLVDGETAIAHGYSGDMFVQFLDTDDPDRYEYFVPEEGGARWIDTMAIPFDAPHPCTAHTFINWLLDGEQGAALANWNYYETPNDAALPDLDEELLEFTEDQSIIVGGPDSVELINNTGDFELTYTDAFVAITN
jgi:spermidine/putrescine-binding protein